MKLSKFIENQTELVEAVRDSECEQDLAINGNELSKFIAIVDEYISNESLDLLEKQIAVIKKSHQYEAEVEEAFNKTFGDMKELGYHRYDDKKHVGELLDIYHSRSELLGICGDLQYEDDWLSFRENPTIEIMDKELARLDKEIENFRKEFPKIAEAYKPLQKNESRL